MKVVRYLFIIQSTHVFIRSNLGKNRTSVKVKLIRLEFIALGKTVLHFYHSNNEVFILKTVPILLF